MNVRFLSDARAELEDAALDYERARPGLGDDFFAQIDAALTRVGDFPEAYPPAAQEAGAGTSIGFPIF